MRAAFDGIDVVDERNKGAQLPFRRDAKEPGLGAAFGQANPVVLCGGVQDEPGPDPEIQIKVELVAAAGIEGSPLDGRRERDRAP